ncbi:unnamed protein product [Phaeothamnion confervicola]
MQDSEPARRPGSHRSYGSVLTTATALLLLPTCDGVGQPWSHAGGYYPPHGAGNGNPTPENGRGGDGSFWNPQQDDQGAWPPQQWHGAPQRQYGAPGYGPPSSGYPSQPDGPALGSRFRGLLNRAKDKVKELSNDLIGTNMGDGGPAQYGGGGGGGGGGGSYGPPGPAPGYRPGDYPPAVSQGQYSAAGGGEYGAMPPVSPPYGYPQQQSQGQCYGEEFRQDGGPDAPQSPPLQQQQPQPQQQPSYQTNPQYQWGQGESDINGAWNGGSNGAPAAPGGRSGGDNVNGGSGSSGSRSSEGWTRGYDAGAPAAAGAGGYRQRWSTEEFAADAWSRAGAGNTPAQLRAAGDGAAAGDGSWLPPAHWEMPAPGSRPTWETASEYQSGGAASAQAGVSSDGERPAAAAVAAAPSSSSAAVDPMASTRCALGNLPAASADGQNSTIGTVAEEAVSGVAGITADSAWFTRPPQAFGSGARQPRTGVSAAAAAGDRYGFTSGNAAASSDGCAGVDEEEEKESVGEASSLGQRGMSTAARLAVQGSRGATAAAGGDALPSVGVGYDTAWRECETVDDDADVANTTAASVSDAEEGVAVPPAASGSETKMPAAAAPAAENTGVAEAAPAALENEPNRTTESLEAAAAAKMAAGSFGDTYGFSIGAVSAYDPLCEAEGSELPADDLAVKEPSASPSQTTDAATAAASTAGSSCEEPGWTSSAHNGADEMHWMRPLEGGAYNQEAQQTPPARSLHSGRVPPPPWWHERQRQTALSSQQGERQRQHQDEQLAHFGEQPRPTTWQHQEESGSAAPSTMAAGPAPAEASSLGGGPAAAGAGKAPWWAATGPPRQIDGFQDADEGDASGGFTAGVARMGSSTESDRRPAAFAGMPGRSDGGSDGGGGTGAAAPRGVRSTNRPAGADVHGPPKRMEPSAASAQYGEKEAKGDGEAWNDWDLQDQLDNYWRQIRSSSSPDGLRRGDGGSGG